jgi:hypothetical protein
LAGAAGQKEKMLMEHRKIWETSVDEAVRIFREGLLALIPVVEKAKCLGPIRTPTTTGT